MKISKKLLSLLLCAVMVPGSVAVGGEGLAEVLDAFSIKASAASSGKELSKDGGKITCKAGFFRKLIAFFRGLFKSLPKVEVKP